MIAHECLLDHKCRHKQCIILKLDFEKAYDMVKWFYLFIIMQLSGFNEKWVRWIKCCMSTTKLSVGINRKSFGFFAPTRGPRQGGPIPPTIFLVGHVLSILLEKSEHFNLLDGIEVGANSESYSPSICRRDLLFSSTKFDKCVSLKIILS